MQVHRHVIGSMKLSKEADRHIDSVIGSIEISTEGHRHLD